jgi:hypothetical protein
MISTYKLAAMLALALLSHLAAAGIFSKKDASQTADEPKRGRRIAENQALGRALDKKPIGIAVIRRAGDKANDALSSGATIK